MKRYLLLISMLAAFVAESAAREVYRLNDDWTFYFRSENSADDARNITLPHTWNLDALAGNSEYQRTTGNYMRRLYIPADWASKRLFLRFDGVQTVADVFVNGYHVGEHRGGFTAFTFETACSWWSATLSRTTYCPPRPSRTSTAASTATSI